MVSHLGTGEFGSVSKGLWTSESGVVEVAVKTLTDSVNTVKFLQEAAIMAQFRHPNIVSLHGVVSHGTPVSREPCIIRTSFSSVCVCVCVCVENDGVGTNAQRGPPPLSRHSKFKVCFSSNYRKHRQSFLISSGSTVLIRKLRSQKCC